MFTNHNEDVAGVFTAIRFISSGEVYAHVMTADDVPRFVPWRIDVDYLPVQIAPSNR